jgi:hypothetical protein
MRFIGVNHDDHQNELPLGVRRRSRRRYPPAARRFFALGELLRRQLEAERARQRYSR